MGHEVEVGIAIQRHAHHRDATPGKVPNEAPELLVAKATAILREGADFYGRVNRDQILADVGAALRALDAARPQGSSAHA